MEALGAAGCADRTCVVIAHDLNTIRHADEIFLIQDAVISERGTHESLLASGGAYAGMYRLETASVGTRAPGLSVRVRALRKERSLMIARRWWGTGALAVSLGLLLAAAIYGAAGNARQDETPNQANAQTHSAAPDAKPFAGAGGAAVGNAAARRAGARCPESGPEP